MSYSEENMREFVALLARHTPKEGLNEMGIAGFFTFRETTPRPREAVVYEPAIAILGQGRKYCYLDGQKYDYSAGRYLTLFLPMPIEVEVCEATPSCPLLMAGIKIDLIKIADLLLKINKVTQSSAKFESTSTSAIFSRPLNDNLLEPVIRLLRTLDNPIERAVLGEPILEEIYFRLICDDRSGALQRLLHYRGQVQQISKVVDHIHHHLDEAVSVNRLASMVNMSPSSFRKLFRAVMHMPPLQYAKSIKLNRAQVFIREGKNANEAGYLVGYNSPAQFSREYKRHFGYSPSETRIIV